MINKSLLGIICSFVVFAGSCFASPGDVIFTNANYPMLGNTNAIQFQLVTNGSGLVTSAVLSAMPPDNSQTLHEYNFSDQTQQFDVYIRDASSVQNPYRRCSGTISYQHNYKPITIQGWNDGANMHCAIEIGLSSK